MKSAKTITRFLIIISCLAFLTSCKNKQKDRTTKKSVSLPNYINDGFAYLENINDPNYLVALLDNSNEVEGERIGIDGRQSNSYSIFKRLCAVASDTTLVRLLSHKNPKIRVYSIWALTNNNRQLALKHMKQIKKDKGIVTYKTGCTSLTGKVAWFALLRLDSTKFGLYKN